MKNEITKMSVLIGIAFLIFGTWEWIQTPFFIDSTPEINQIVWNRIHCTIGDIMILFSTYFILMIIRRKYISISNLNKNDIIILTIMGLSYTVFSEYLNVHIRESWGYSELMPIVPVLKAGFVPLLQWIILPSLIFNSSKIFLKGMKLEK